MEWDEEPFLFSHVPKGTKLANSFVVCLIKPWLSIMQFVFGSWALFSTDLFMTA